MKKEEKKNPHLEVGRGRLDLVHPGVSLEPLAVDKLLGEEKVVAVEPLDNGFLLEFTEEYLKVGQEVRPHAWS